MSSKRAVDGSGAGHPSDGAPEPAGTTGSAKPADTAASGAKQAEEPESYCPEGCLTTGEMARMSRNTLRTVRFYESEGLIKADSRPDGTHRRFPAEELQKLLAITDLRESGLSLQAIKELIALKAGCPTAIAAARTMGNQLCQQIEALDQRIETMQRVRAELSSMLCALEPCRDCTHPDFPQRCRECPSLSVTGAERPTLLLWRH